MSKEKGIRIRMTEVEKNTISENAKKNNFRSISEYLRFLGMNTVINVVQK